MQRLADRKMQRALMQFFKPENYFMVREALLKAGRGDLIGNGCDCLIPPAAEAALRARRKRRTVRRGDGNTSRDPVARTQQGRPTGAEDSAARQQTRIRERRRIRHATVSRSYLAIQTLASQCKPDEPSKKQIAS